MPEALVTHTELDRIMATDGGDCAVEFAESGIDQDALYLPKDGAKSFVKSWNCLTTVIASKSTQTQ
ncbi:MAG: hypothetical protein ACKVP0_26085 [Pirellulaceae bacterium]